MERRAEGVFKTNLGASPEPEPGLEDLAQGVQKAWAGALGDLKHDAVAVGKSLATFPYISAFKLIGVAVVLYGTFYLFKRFGKIYSKLA